METSEALSARVRKRFAHLLRVHDHITHCDVAIEVPHQHQQQGKLFEVRIRLVVPGAELLVNHEGPENRAHEDAYVAVRDAFDAAERKLAVYAQQLGHRQHTS